VFVGTLIVHDLTTARFHIDQVRWGSTADWEVAGQIDVRFGNEVRFLDVDQQYLVGAGVGSAGALSSTVAAPTPLFGGSSVIGLNESDIDCPTVEDGMRTLHVDGTTIDSGVFTPLRNSKQALLGAVLRPMGWTFATLLVLVAMKHLVVGFVRSMRGTPAVVPVRRTRHHHPVER
jgi:hypothetical protein